MAHIAEDIQRITERIQAASERAGRDASGIRLVAVSKTVGLPEVAQAIASGLHDFGENREPLFTEKFTAYPTEHWHFIGSIQTNKLKAIVGRAALIHSVASEHALAQIAKRALAANVVQDVLLEVNVSGEASKDGVAPGDLPALIEYAAALDGLCVRGLMTMAPQGDPAAAHEAFAGLRTLLAEQSGRYNDGEHIALKELSMGMSEDFEIAIEEGATILRIGRALWL